jgi:multiple sugar transport system substrate-binding protein
MVALVLVAAACGPGPTGTPSAAASPTSGASAEATPAQPSGPVATFSLPSFEPAALRWYCCLGTGAGPDEQPVESDVAAGIATAFPGSSLAFEAIAPEDAAPTLANRLRDGDAPDVVGPLGMDGFAAFTGEWLDLAPAIAASHYDLGQFPAQASEQLRLPEGQVGIPFALDPSMLWYQKDMFAAAGLHEPPHRFGDEYTMPDGSVVEWSYDTLQRVARLLTLDSSGRNATDPAFDPKRVVQWGFEPFRDDLRGLAAFWGSGSLTGPDGTTAAIPDAWQAAWRFFYDGMWTSHFIPTGPQLDSQAFDGDLDVPFFSGHVAMTEAFLSTTFGVAAAGASWDLAATPSFSGTVSVPLAGETFGVPKASKQPDAAFAALTNLLDESSAQLLAAYGEMPARPGEQDAFFAALGQTDGFPAQVDWQVARDSLTHAGAPSFLAPTPKAQDTTNILAKYLSVWTTTPGLDMGAQMEALRAELQRGWSN